MKREDFASLLLGTVGGIFFALGMCMCLITEWHAFSAGVIVGLAGVAVLLEMVRVRRRMQGKPPIRISGRTLGIAALAVAGALILGVGMCMTMVWDGLLIPGILVGIIGVILLLALIPVCIGLE